VIKGNEERSEKRAGDCYDQSGSQGWRSVRVKHWADAGRKKREESTTEKNREKREVEVDDEGPDFGSRMVSNYRRSYPRVECAARRSHQSQRTSGRSGVHRASFL